MACQFLSLACQVASQLSQPSNQSQPNWLAKWLANWHASQPNWLANSNQSQPNWLANVNQSQPNWLANVKWQARVNQAGQPSGKPTPTKWQVTLAFCGWIQLGILRLEVSSWRSPVGVLQSFRSTPVISEYSSHFEILRFQK